MDQLRDTPDAVSTMLELKKEGKIRAFAISVKNPTDAAAAINEFGAEVIQLNFNMIDQRAFELGAFDLAKEKKVGVIARTPLAFGFLSGKINDLHFNPKDHRSVWSEAQLKRWAEAPDLFSFVNRDPNRTPTQLALQFCLGFDAISTVIPGMLNEAEVNENAVASDLPKLSKEELEAIETVYKGNEFFVKNK
jgi:aryl-alcohol dehydrogenase-like predicted oxidoreductase